MNLPLLLLDIIAAGKPARAVKHAGAAIGIAVIVLCIAALMEMPQ